MTGLCNMSCEVPIARDSLAYCTRFVNILNNIYKQYIDRLSGWDYNGFVITKRKSTTAAVHTPGSDTLASFTMQVLVRQTGIAADTLRAWERRYGFPSPARTEGGHRLYTTQDVEAIRWVLQKQQEGLRAKQAIELWQHERARATAATPEPTPTAPNRETLDVLRTAWVRACLALDDQAAAQVFNSAAAMLGPESALLNVATAGLSHIGEQWEAGSASVAQEHFASAVATRQAQSLLNGLPAATRPQKVLVTAPEGEIHVYPSVVLTYLLRRAGWDIIYLGANLPVKDLSRTLTQEHPVCVVVAVQTVPALSALLADAQATAAAGVPFAFGGSVFVRYPSLAARVPGFYLGGRLADATETLPGVLDGALQPNVPAPLARPWRELRRDLPDALLAVEAAVLRKGESLRLARPEVEAELGLLRAYVLSLVEVGAPELLPGIWSWSDRMQKARGFDSAAREGLLATYRAALREQLAHAGPLEGALEGEL